MDELREERDELAALERDTADSLERDTADEAREQAQAVAVWTDSDGLEWAQHVAAETERWSR